MSTKELSKQERDELQTGLEARYLNKCIGGKCSGCGDCCTDLLPLTQKEVDRLREYAIAHDLRAHTQMPFYESGGVDLTCPFRNQITGKCDVYEVRPHICRLYICSKQTRQATIERNRWTFSKGVSTRSLRYEIFGDRTTILFTKAVVLKEYYDMKAGMNRG